MQKVWFRGSCEGRGPSVLNDPDICSGSIRTAPDVIIMLLCSFTLCSCTLEPDDVLLRTLNHQARTNYSGQKMAYGSSLDGSPGVVRLLLVRSENLSLLNKSQ